MCHRSAPRGTHATLLPSSLSRIGTLDRSFTLVHYLSGDNARALIGRKNSADTKGSEEKGADDVTILLLEGLFVPGSTLGSEVCTRGVELS